MNITLSFDWLKELVHPYPARDWSIAVMLGMLLFLVALGVAGYLYFAVQTGMLIGAGGGQLPPPTPIPRATMQKVLETYGERLTNFEAQNFPTYPLVDPHLTLAPKK